MPESRECPYRYCCLFSHPLILFNVNVIFLIIWLLEALSKHVFISIPCKLLILNAFFSIHCWKFIQFKHCSHLFETRVIHSEMRSEYVFVFLCICFYVLVCVSKKDSSKEYLVCLSDVKILFSFLLTLCVSRREQCCRASWKKRLSEQQIIQLRISFACNWISFQNNHFSIQLGLDWNIRQLFFQRFST